MNKAEAVLFELIKKSLFNIPPTIPYDVDWKDVLKEAKAQTVVALVADAVPKEYSKEWQILSSQSTAHYMRALYEQTNLCKLLNTNGIPFVIIKGAAAAMYYPRPQLRTMGDIDFLVPEKDFNRSRALLEENGYVFCGDYGDDRDYTYQKGSVIFELHHRYSDNRLDIESFITEGACRAETHEIGGHTFPTLPEAINGLVLLDHIRHHIYGGLGIRQIIDFMMFINAQEQLDDFLQLVKKARLYTFLKVLIKMCVKYFGLPDRFTFCEDADDDLAEEFLNTVLSGGNFGRKDPYQYKPMESLALSVREKGIFSFLQTAGLQNWQAAKKYTFLRPFAFIYQIFRLIKRGIRALFHGEDLKKDFTAGNDKKDFYDKLGI